MTSTELAAWVQAIGSLVAIGVAIWLGRASDKRARELVASERRRQANIAKMVLANRLRTIASEARAKAAWLRKDGVPHVLGEPAPAGDHQSAGRRLRLTSGEALTKELAPMLLLLDGLPAVFAAQSFSLVADYNDHVSASIDTHDGASLAAGFGAWMRQNLQVGLCSKLDLVELNAAGNADKLDEDWRLPGSPEPDDHRRSPWWRRAISFSWFRSWMSAKDKPNS